MQRFWQLFMLSGWLMVLLAATVCPFILKEVPANAVVDDPDALRKDSPVNSVKPISPTRSAAFQGAPQGSSCANPLPSDVPVCETIERNILASTVRLEIEAWIKHGMKVNGAELFAFEYASADGHATIMDGRFLVTHNHLSIPISAFEDTGAVEFGTLALYKANGELLIRAVRPTQLAIAAVQQETLVLDLGIKEDGLAFFDLLGMPSAQFGIWLDLGLQPGVEVAQVDWDGVTTSVNWVSVDNVIVDEGVPRIVLSDGMTPGASGGGVFWSGHHIANNWTLNERIGQNGSVLNASSTAALNSDDILTKVWSR